MTEQHVRAVKLAGELGVGIRNLQIVFHELRITAPNGASWVSSKDAARCRQWFENERRRVAEERAALIRRENAAVLDRFRDTQAPQRPKIDGPVPLYSCACCGRSVGRPSIEMIEFGADLYCPLCVEHYEIPDEPPDRELERLRAHDADLRAYARKAWVMATEYRDRMKGAYRSRDTWRASFAEVVLPHEPGEDGACVTCRRPAPCEVWTALEDSNRGVFKEMEKLSGLEGRDLELALYPERVTDRDFDRL
ncbi:hypothetical protein [Nocardia grenadensis]|uniref:hypothetical protein n=1 Tax=Nocardia grenadensis TaxID=931537 RepID=UPI0007A4F524|nr:hypothetical protein [Nocardia grenadensis]